MQTPTPAPTLVQLIDKYIVNGEMDVKTLLRLHGDLADPAPDGRYRHWHKLQFLTPPVGASSEVWWLAIKMARASMLKHVPLIGIDGKPFSFTMPDVLQEMIHKIDRRAAGAIQGSGILPSEKEKRFFLLKSLREEAITSSQLEGAATTRKVAKRMLLEGRKPKDKSEQMIVNNFRAMQFISGHAKKRELTSDLVFELHHIITENTLDNPDAVGRFRHDAEEIAVVDEYGKVLHDPPPEAELPQRLEAMCRFANDTTDGQFIHPVVRSILLHFWLAYDHPFCDGNGRTARALYYWSMARLGYWLIEYTSISRLLLQARGRYNMAFLYSETDENDATYFILHQCRTILRAIDELHEYIARKADDARRGHVILRDSGAFNLGLNNRQLTLVRHAVDHPGMQYSIRSHRLYHNVSYQTARTDLLHLADKGLLYKTKVGHEMIFLAPDDLLGRLEQVQ